MTVDVDDTDDGKDRRLLVEALGVRELPELALEGETEMSGIPEIRDGEAKGYCEGLSVM